MPHSLRRRFTVVLATAALVASVAPTATAASAPVVNPEGETVASVPVEVRNETGEPGEATYIVLLRGSSLARYEGGTAGLAPTSPEVTGETRLDTESAASRAYLEHLAAERVDMIGAIETALDRSVDVKFTYDAVLNGFAVVLTPDEAQTVASLEGVRHVERDSKRELHTDNGPRWIGADSAWGQDPPGSAECAGTCGEGVVAGIIDTGINFDHPSFAATGGDGFVHDNPRGRFFGACDPIIGAPFCNTKLIGYYDFTGTGPEDDNGHGSHTASTAAGNVLRAVLQAPTITVERDISGVAPHANIISYKGCSGTPVGCQLSALVASINQATLDQVDVINYSIGGSSANPWSDLDAQAFFDAYTAGIFVATSAGNDGPGFGTLGSPADAPWVTSVGASTHDRALANGLINMTNADGSAGPADVFGASLTAGLPAARVVYAGDYGFPLCGDGAADPTTGESAINPFPPGTFNGEIVVCDRGTYGRVAKANNVAEGGAGGYVLANDQANGDSLVADPYPIPGVHISFDHGVIVKGWIADNGGLEHQGTGEIRGSSPAEDPANGDIMASFSSRGANPAVPSVIKPDVTAPGVDILAAWMSPVGSIGGDPEFNVISGTSMSSPHTAGSGALVRAAHPDWSPDEVKSALMTTAFTTAPGTGGEVHDVLKEDKTTVADPFDMGAGRVDLRRAPLAGLVLDETPADYDAAAPALAGDPSSLNLASLGNDFCPSSCVWTRTVRSTASSTVTWTPSASTPAGMAISFDQTSYTLAPGESTDIRVVADVTGVSTPGEWIFAEVQLNPSDSAIPTAHLPVAVVPADGPAPIVLTMHGNLHDGCTGDGAADVAGNPDCSPFLSQDPELDTAPAASWGPINNSVDGTAPVNVFDPNWEWDVTETTTVQGPMTVEWWFTGPAVNTVLFDDFDIRLYADDNLVIEERVRHNVTVPNVPELLRSTITVPKATASASFVIQIDPVFVNQNESFIYFDSAESCPGVTAEVPCNSQVSMPVVENIDAPPVANDDDAFVLNGGTVVIDVLANDSDPEGGPLAVNIVTAPSNGTADVTTDNRISYTHDGSSTSGDSLVYEVTDNAGQTDTATVSISVSNECFVPGGDFFDDFESGAPGWTVDTAVVTAPSQTWQLLSPDPLATSPTTVWFTDALAQELVNGGTAKDVRLVSPSVLTSGESQVSFWHRFDTEPGFDGGVLEISLDDGATWVDVIDAGGVFIQGAYNDTIDPSNDGNPLQGREAWAGPSTPPAGATEMSQVIVDMGAFAGSTVQFRFRFGQDELVGQPGGGWWIDDVTVSNLFEKCDSRPVANDDTDVVDAGGMTNTDVKANDTDPDTPSEDLTVTIESGPSSGSTVVEADGTVTYTHNGDSATSDSYVYRITDPEGGSDTATVTITINQDGGGGDEVTGGGYLETTEGKKINFGFDVRTTADGSIDGHLKLADKTEGVKIKVDVIESLGEVGDGCGSVEAGSSSLEFAGSGAYNGDPAEFRVCVTDSGEGEPDNGDLLYLECTVGCDYNTGDRTDDDEIDGGNIQVERAAESSGSGSTQSAEGDGEATVLILDPLLTTEGIVGERLELTVTALDINNDPAGEAPVTITITTDAGTVSFEGVTGVDGVVTFVADLTLGDTVFQTHSGQASSNFIDVTAIPLT